jgi:2-polyprenyl-3-methyl-5-hydroxy-6-metoxy-1,4-benzoquinol methylase
MPDKTPRIQQAKSPRVRWVEESVRRRYLSGRILDVGCVGDYAQSLLHIGFREQGLKSEIIGVDINIEGLTRLRLPNTLAADGARLPFKNGSFDAVLFLELLEHIYCPTGMLSESWRVLREGGNLMITTPNNFAWWNMLRYWVFASLAGPMPPKTYRRYLGDKDHKQFYDPLSLMNLLYDAGFEPFSLTTKNHTIPILQRWFRPARAMDLPFYPMSRLGHYLCIIARKAHLPKSARH